MSVKFSTRALSANLPLCRWQLYEDLVCDGKSGPVDRLWLSPGHVYVTIRQGSQLFTFDTKPTSKAHEEHRGCLDLQDLNPPVLDILVSSTNYNLVYIVQRNGHVQCWKFRGDLTWILVQRFDLCKASRSEITSICLHSSQTTFYWCERQITISPDVANYHICKQQISDDEDKLRAKDFSPAQVILHSCPPSIVYPVSFGVAIVIKMRPPLVSMVMFWLPVTNRVVIHIGPHQVELPEFSTRQPIDFRSLAFKTISFTVQMKAEHQMKGVTYDPQAMEVIVIEQQHNIRRISDTKGMEGNCPKLCFNDSKKTGDIISWFTFQGFLGVLCKSHILLFDKVAGNLVDTLSSPENSDIVDVCQLCPGVIWASFFTTHNAYIIQKTKVTKEEEIEDMLNLHNFQTKAVELAYLEQLKIQSNDIPVYGRISKLGKAWEIEGSRPPNTKLAETINPYLKEYWSLEKFQQDILNGRLILPSVCPGDIEEEVLRVLSPETSLSMSGRQVWLLVLADRYPQEVLTILMKQLDFDTEDINSAQLQRWQCILAKDSVVSPVSTNVAVPMFEHICRLLFIVQPNKLVNFVKIAQLINDQRVGVSAFIRRRQALQYYDRALLCLPELSKSQDKEEATPAYIQLLLASEQDGCEMKAVQTYIDQECWMEAIRLLSQFYKDQSLHMKLFHTVLLSMAQKEVLPQYADELFKVMPIFKSFDSVMSALPKKPNRDGSGTGSVEQVFATDANQVQISQVCPYLLENIRTTEDIDKKDSALNK